MCLQTCIYAYMYLYVYANINTFMQVGKDVRMYGLLRDREVHRLACTPLKRQESLSEPPLWEKGLRVCFPFPG